MDISIVITTYNYQHYIQQCLESCLEQNTDLDYEVIIVNDGSTDKTQEILDKFKDQERLTLIEIQNSGIEKASNKGFLYAKGEFIVRLDADDMQCQYSWSLIQLKLKMKNMIFSIVITM